MRTGVTALQYGQPTQGRLLVRFFSQLAAHEQADALVAVTLAEGEPRSDAVVGRDAQIGMRGLHSVDLYRFQIMQRPEQLVADVGRFHAGQVEQAADGPFQQPLDVLQAFELGKAGRFVAGLRAKVTAQLGDLRDGTDGRLGRRGGGAGREHDLGAGREGGRVPGHRADSGQRHAQGEILEHDMDAFPLKGGQQVA